MVNFSNHTTRPTPIDYAAEDVDASIALDAGTPPGITSHRIVGDRRVPVCAPALMAGGGLAAVADLARHTLLQHSIQPRAWADWLAMMGARGVDGFRGPRFQHHAMVAEAAAQGMGVALMPRFMLRRNSRRGGWWCRSIGRSMLGNTGYLSGGLGDLLGATAVSIAAGGGGGRLRGRRPP